MPVGLNWVSFGYTNSSGNVSVDPSLALDYNGELLSSGQWSGDGHNTLQAIDLYSAGASSVYYDNIVISAL